jgi:hypothetical protein
VTYWLEAIAVEVKIGVQNVAREIVLDSAQTADEVAAQVDAAIAAGGTLRLVDSTGRTVVVPTAVLGYVEAGGHGGAPGRLRNDLSWLPGRLAAPRRVPSLTHQTRRHHVPSWRDCASRATILKAGDLRLPRARPEQRRVCGPNSGSV